MLNTIYIKSQTREVDEGYDLLKKRCEVKYGSMAILSHINDMHGICFKNDKSKSKMYSDNYAIRAFPNQAYT